MTYSILFDCGCGFAINGGINQFCEIHKEELENIKGIKEIIMYRASVGYIYTISEHDGVIAFTTRFQEGITI